MQTGDSNFPSKTECNVQHAIPLLIVYDGFTQGKYSPVTDKNMNPKISLENAIGLLPKMKWETKSKIFHFKFLLAH